jgi:hypothetical protein
MRKLAPSQGPLCLPFDDSSIEFPAAPSAVSLSDLHHPTVRLTLPSSNPTTLAPLRDIPRLIYIYPGHCRLPCQMLPLRNRHHGYIYGG